VISGATSGPNPDLTELNRIFFLQLRVIGSTMGTRAELAQLVSLLDATGTTPLVDRVLPMTEAREGFAAMESGDGLALGEIRHTHPRFGELDLYQWCLFVAEHEKRHVTQLRGVVAQLAPAP